MTEVKASWVVIPAYNEENVIQRMVRGVREYCPRVVVVDDGSRDQTSLEARRGGAIVVRHIVNMGQGAALQTGIEFALSQGADYIVTFDADGQHLPEDIVKLLETLVSQQVGIVLGSRFLGSVVNLPPLRRLTLKLAILFTRLSTGLNLTDTHNGLRAMTAATACRIEIKQNKMAHASEILEQISKYAIPYQEVPVTVIYTPYSQRKGQSIFNALNILSELFASRLRK